jgi:hypothetical protein
MESADPFGGFLAKPSFEETGPGFVLLSCILILCVECGILETLCEANEFPPKLKDSILLHLMSVTWHFLWQ